MSDYFWLVLSCLGFVGSHFAMSHTFRKALIRSFGKSAFMGFYSVTSLGFFGVMIFAFRGAPRGNPMWLSNGALWVIASIITLVAAVLFTGSFSSNPSLPSPASADLATRMPTGVFKVTRHPMMWSFALWGVAHIIIAPRPAVLILIGSIIFLALVGARAQERKKAKMMGVEWEMWLRRTSFLPRISGFLRVPATIWIGGIVLWLVSTWAHAFFALPPAGIFSWI
jgi:uncharacterized membrane protein